MADDIRPNAIMVTILSGLSKIFPTWQIVPGQDINEIAFKLPEVRQQVYIIYIFIYLYLYLYFHKSYPTN